MNNKNNTNEWIHYGIDKKIIKALNIMGYYEPMEVQKEVIKYVLNNKDIIVKSKTGSGKTGAFAIPIVNKLKLDINNPQVLILTPTRELTVQICDEISHIGKYNKVRCLSIYGKQPIKIQINQLKQRIHVVVGTPGRVLDLIKKDYLKLNSIKYLVIDEADELLNRGFIEQVESIIENITTNHSTLLFSATMPNEIKSICSQYMNNATNIEIETKENPIEKIKQYYYKTTEEFKITLLNKLLDNMKPESCIIFCNTRNQVNYVTQQLKNMKYKCTCLHGDMAQKFRLKSINEFKEGKYRYLVATDLASRGIHVDNLELVINYDIPFENESYVHRIGRTGRVLEKGKAISLISDNDENKWSEIQEYIGYSVPKELIENIAKYKRNKAISTDIKRGNRSKSKAYKDISRIRINAGKKKKIRTGDVLGALSNLEGIKAEDIGIINIQETCTYVEIFNNKGNLVLKELPKSKIKGKKITIKKV